MELQQIFTTSTKLNIHNGFYEFIAFLCFHTKKNERSKMMEVEVNMTKPINQWKGGINHPLSSST
jgi:hypothetical protein